MSIPSNPAKAVGTFTPRVVAMMLAVWLFAGMLALRGATAGFAEEKLREIDAAFELAIADGKCPGGVLWIERRGQSYHRAYGSRAVVPAREANAEDTIYDAASLTKVLATTSAVMKLVEDGKVALEAPVMQYIPEFKGNGKEAITVRHLMTHTSGLRAGLSLAKPWEGPDEALARACAEPLPNAPGETFRYSDINFIVLGELVRKVSGQPLDEFCAAQIFGPLKMTDTMFRPRAELRARVAPTTENVERGVVHDPTARRMGGVAGHAGLFTTAADMARFLRMMLNGGELEGVRVFKAETVKLMTSVHSPESLPHRRGLGWDIDTAYAGQRGMWFPVGGYGHTGWTGGSLWIDPFSESFVILLSNRNHPTERGSVIGLRSVIGSLAAEAMRDFNFAFVPGSLPRRAGAMWLSGPRTAPVRPEVLCGIDVLVRDDFKPLKGLRVGLITNHTGIDKRGRTTIDLLHKAKDVKLVALFSPEHGIRGALDEKVSDSKDEKTGLPIYSLYGEKRAPTAEQFAGLDALVFDIQDIGCRFYTYISTLGECMSVAGKEKKKFFVLDRPNPIGGVAVEGPMRDGEGSFVAWHEIPVRHGMTVGELAKMYNEERKLGVELTVVQCENWTRDVWFDGCGLPWVNPSPNMRSLNAAALYPGVGLIEFCKVSVGRGTDRPFELVGAPYIDERKLADELNALELPGVRFMPIRFTPNASVFKGKECNGVQINVINREVIPTAELGVALATVIHRHWPKEFVVDNMTKLLVHPSTLEAVKEGKSLGAIRGQWVEARKAFVDRRARFLIYP